MEKTNISKLRTYFISGLVVILPIFLTAIILKWFVGKINMLLLEPFIGLLRPYTDSGVIILLLKIALFLVIIALIILCGAATRIFFMRRFFTWAEQLLLKPPLINKIYNAFKEVSTLIFRNKKGLFKKVVMIEYPRPGLLAVGFVTCERVDSGLIKRASVGDLVSVFVPTTPNPTTGSFVLVKSNEIIDADMTVEEALKLILSGGALSPNDKGLNT